MDMRELLGEHPVHRWIRLLLFAGIGLAVAFYALSRESAPLLAGAVDLIMIGTAYFFRPLGHFTGLFSRAVFARLASSPAVLACWIGGWTLNFFGIITSLAL